MHAQPDNEDAHVDVLVLGAGMAGLCAAAAVAEEHAAVLVAEKAPMIGGSAALSHGTVWTVNNRATLQREDAGSHQRHGSLVVDGFDMAIDQLDRFGARLGDRVAGPYRKAQRFDLALTFLRIAQAVETTGGKVSTSTSVKGMERDGHGYRVLLQVEGDSVPVVASAMVLATGGRQADPVVRTDLAGPASILRGNPYSDGAGMELARSLGATVNSSNRGFYGHLLFHGVKPLSAFDYRALALYHSSCGVLLDRNGERFTDEKEGDPRNALALASRGGDGALLWSEATQARAAVDPAPVDLKLDRWTYARDRGGEVARAHDAAEAGQILRSWGFSHPSHSLELEGDLTGTIFMARVTPGVTYTYGGLQATPKGEVIGLDGRTVPGVFVAGADMSDIYHEGYCGGLSAAAVTGFTAGREAARWARRASRS